MLALFDYYVSLIEDACVSTWRLLGLNLTTICFGVVTFVIGTWDYYRRHSEEAAMGELDVAWSYVVVGLGCTAGAALGFNLIRAPWVRNNEQQTTIGRLRDQLQLKQSQTVAQDWKALSKEFGEYGEHIVDLLALDWNKEGNVDHGWSFRGEPHLIPIFEPLARKGGKLVRRSTYCQSVLAAETFSHDDPVRLWAEAIRALTSTFKLRDRVMWSVDDETGERHYYQSGFINNVFQASGLLCLEMESREADA